MINIALYSTQPMLVAGMNSAMATQKDLFLSFSGGDTPSFLEHIIVQRPNVLLIEMNAEIDLSFLKSSKQAASGSPMVAWTGTTSSDLAKALIQWGFTGILPRSLPIEMQLNTLRSWGQGEHPFDQVLVEQRLGRRRPSWSRRECELASLLVQGLKNKEIAHAMSITEGTAKVYLSTLLAKAGVTDRFELAAYALQNMAHLFPEGSAEKEDTTARNRPTLSNGPNKGNSGMMGEHDHRISGQRRIRQTFSSNTWSD